MTEVGTDLERRVGAIETLVGLEQHGVADAVSLDLSGSAIPYERWESIGRFLGGVEKASRWWIGDWMVHGEMLFGEEAAQAVEGTRKERYDLAERVTGLDPDTLKNYRSTCNRVGRTRRREELTFGHHSEVASLEADDQAEWLQRAIDEGWGRNDLREAIREAKTPALDPGGEPGGEPGEPGLSPGERIEIAARQVYNLAQPTTDGNFIVPAESIHLLGSALGEE